jgi:hypothetical protein
MFIDDILNDVVRETQSEVELEEVDDEFSRECHTQMNQQHLNDRLHH